MTRVGGLHIDGLLIHTGQFQHQLIGLLGFMHLGGRHPLGGLELLLETVEQIEGSGGAQGQHGLLCEGWAGSVPR
jgi:hypothetical protein